MNLHAGRDIRKDVFQHLCNLWFQFLFQIHFDSYSLNISLADTRINTI